MTPLNWGLLGFVPTHGPFFCTYCCLFLHGQRAGIYCFSHKCGQHVSLVAPHLHCSSRKTRTTKRPAAGKIKESGKSPTALNAGHRLAADGRAQGRGNDYGIVALAPNPWSEEHIVVIAAGVHGPGSAGALKMLASPEQFAQRPWGGVVQVTTPPLAPWQHLFERHLHPRFETHEYDPAKYLQDLQIMIDRIKTPMFREVKTSEETLKRTLAFAERLAKPAN